MKIFRSHPIAYKITQILTSVYVNYRSVELPYRPLFKTDSDKAKFSVVNSSQCKPKRLSLFTDVRVYLPFSAKGTNSIVNYLSHKPKSTNVIFTNFSLDVFNCSFHNFMKNPCNVSGFFSTMNNLAQINFICSGNSTVEFIRVGANQVKVICSNNSRTGFLEFNSKDLVRKDFIPSCLSYGLDPNIFLKKIEFCAEQSFFIKESLDGWDYKVKLQAYCGKENPLEKGNDLFYKSDKDIIFDLTDPRKIGFNTNVIAFPQAQRSHGNPIYPAEGYGGNPPFSSELIENNVNSYNPAEGYGGNPPFSSELIENNVNSYNPAEGYEGGLAQIVGIKRNIADTYTENEGSTENLLENTVTKRVRTDTHAQDNGNIIVKTFYLYDAEKPESSQTVSLQFDFSLLSTFTKQNSIEGKNYLVSICREARKAFIDAWGERPITCTDSEGNVKEIGVDNATILNIYLDYPDNEHYKLLRDALLKASNRSLDKIFLLNSDFIESFNPNYLTPLTNEDREVLIEEIKTKYANLK